MDQFAFVGFVDEFLEAFAFDVGEVGENGRFRHGDRIGCVLVNAFEKGKLANGELGE